MFKKLTIYVKQRHRAPLIGFLCLLAIYASGQTILASWRSQNQFDLAMLHARPNLQDTIKQKSTTPKEKGKLIELVFAEELIKRQGFIPQVLIGNVAFYHDGARLYCDSSYYDEGANVFEAFSNVRMEQGDTVFLYGNYMHYDGNTKIVKFRKNVRLEHEPKQVTLFTDSLNYYRLMNTGFYFDGGMLVDTINELTSNWGQYELDLNLATFKGNVKLVNPKFVLTSEELEYNTNDKKAYFRKPTIIESDSGTIRTHNGWYNTTTEEASLFSRSSIVNKAGNQTLIGDTILRHKEKGTAEVFGNMFMEDTVKKVILIGNYGFFDEIADYSMATDSAYVIEYSQGDSLFLSADTLKLITVFDTVKPIVEKKKVDAETLPISTDSLVLSDEEDLLPLVDSLLPITQQTVKKNDSISGTTKEVKKQPAKNDSIYRLIKAYHGVRFYRSDMQGICDSLQFNSRDSILYLYKDPVLWNDNNQLMGDTIEIFMNDSTVDFIHVKRYSFSIEQKDSIHFNQVKGNSMKAYFENKKIRRVLIEGSAESLFYPEEKDKSMIGLNLLSSSYMDIYLKNDGKLDKMKAWPEPVGKMTPLFLLTPEELRLKDFYWYDYLRPLNRDDIFRKSERKATDVKPKRSAIFNREE